MRYNQFKNYIYESVIGSEVKDQTLFYGSTITETIDGYVLVDGVMTDFSSLEEAKESIKQQSIQEYIQKQIQQDLYEEMSHNKIADIIKEHHGDIKITDTLVESYVELASSKIFTLDPVAHAISDFNKMDCIVEGRLDYVLDDGTPIVITEKTYQRINNIFGKYPDVIKHMRSSVESFLSVVDQLEE
jgi:hypothetical protein